MTSNNLEQPNLVKQADEELLASLGYKQEFKRAFTPLEVRSSVSHLLTPLTVNRFLALRSLSLAFYRPLHLFCSMQSRMEADQQWSGEYVIRSSGPCVH
jgi:hypothetical protein